MRATARTSPGCHPVTVGPPTGERAKRHGSRWSAPLDERPWPVALGLLGLSWAVGDGMTRLPPQPPDNLDQAAASILEPEVPAGGTTRTASGEADGAFRCSLSAATASVTLWQTTFSSRQSRTVPML
jgi:hypothetical protein